MPLVDTAYMQTDYGSFRARLLVRIMAGKPTPRQVAEVLKAKKRQFPQIPDSEIERYEFWGDIWPGTPEKPPNTPKPAPREDWEAATMDFPD